MSDWDDDDESFGGLITSQSSYTDHSPADSRNVSFGRTQKKMFGHPTQHDFEFRGKYHEEDSERIYVQGRLCGKIIGKGGTKIRSLEEQSSAKIQVLKDEEDNRGVPILLSGSEESRKQAVRLIDDIVSSCHAARDRSENNIHSQNKNHLSRFHQNETRTVYIRPEECGKVIGRGGSTINQFQEQSGARIKVQSDMKDNEEVPVILTGGKEECDAAEKLITGLITELRDKLTLKSNSFRDRKEPENGFDANGFIDWSTVNFACREQSKKRWENLPPIRKNFYIEDDFVGNMTIAEVEQWRKDNFNLTVVDLSTEKDRQIFNPVMTFEQAFKHYPEILITVQAQGFTKPSPVQSQAWPLITSGYDVIGIAQTGTGKTLAFLLPAFIHIDLQPIPRKKRPGPSCVILTPTRELALQIEAEIKKYHYRDIRCVCVYGGGDRNKQINIVTNGVEIIVATPGRFNDLLANDIITLEAVTFLVLDEADRMLDMGFEPQIMKILLDIRPDRQTVMTSATWPEGVRRLARSYLTDPMQVAVGSLDLAAVHTVHQIVEVLSEEEKRGRLLEHIENMEPNDKVLVFVGRKVTADNLSADLCMLDITCQSIHGGREQYDREQALDDFKTGRARILIATDVASRGLDVADVTHVFNYDYPRNTEEYVHRVGRTGRAGRSGTSITLVTRDDWSTAKELIDILVEADQDVPIELYEMAERFAQMKERREAAGGYRSRGRGGGRRGGFRRERW